MEANWSAVHVVVLAIHLAAEAPLGHHVSALSSEHLFCVEANGGARKGTELAITAVYPLQAILLPHLAVHNADVKGDGNALPWAGRVTTTFLSCEKKTSLVNNSKYYTTDQLKIVKKQNSCLVILFVE